MILDSLILQTKLFLIEDMNINIKEILISQPNSEVLSLKDFTSMIGIGGKISLITVISFEEELLDKLIFLFMDGEEVIENELEEIRQSITGEVINTILGLALPTFPNRGKGITITPPITINDASFLKKHKTSKIVTVSIITDFGTMAISTIGESQYIK